MLDFIAVPIILCHDMSSGHMPQLSESFAAKFLLLLSLISSWICVLQFPDTSCPAMYIFGLPSRSSVLASSAVISSLCAQSASQSAYWFIFSIEVTFRLFPCSSFFLSVCDSTWWNLILPSHRSSSARKAAQTSLSRCFTHLVIFCQRTNPLVSITACESVCHSTVPFQPSSTRRKVSPDSTASASILYECACCVSKGGGCFIFIADFLNRSTPTASTSHLLYSSPILFSRCQDHVPPA